MWLKTHMNATDQQKILNAGFTIIRTEATHVVSHTYNYKIKGKTKTRREWFTLQKDFPTGVAFAARIKELLTDPLTVQD